MSPIIGSAPILSCLKPTLASTNNHYSSSTSQGHGNTGYSTDFTPTSASSVQLSPTVNLSREYTLALQTNSYSEIRRIFYRDIAFNQESIVDVYEDAQWLDTVLQPSRECVKDALSQIKPNSLTHLVTTYFEHSEHTSRLCLLLYQSIRRALVLYNPIHDLLDDISSEFESDGFSLSYSQCEFAFNLFVRFDQLENPFPSPNSHSFDDVRQNFSQLRVDLDQHLRKSKSRVKTLRNCSTGCAYCLIASVVGITISAVAIATHALVALVATGPLCPAIVSCMTMSKKEIIHLAQLDAASKGTYVLQNDLNTIDRLVARLYSAVQDDKLLIRLGLEKEIDKYSVQEILKQLMRNHSSLVKQLSDLEEHIFLCFAATNRARSLLLQEIYLHQEPG